MLRKNDIYSMKKVSCIFTSKNINETAWYGNTDINKDVFLFLTRKSLIRYCDNLSGLFDKAYEELLKYNRIEYVYKNSLVNKIVHGKYSPRTTAWFPEMKIGNSRADGVMVRKDNVAIVYEIKTKYDNLSKVESQISDYYKCFTKVVLMVDESKIEKVISLVPSYVGVYTLTSRNTIKVVRESVDYFGGLNAECMFFMFRKKEYEYMFHKYFPEAMLVSSSLRMRRIKFMLSGIPRIELNKEMVNVIKKRWDGESLYHATKDIPRVLLSAFYEYKIRKSDWSRLKSLLENPIC